MQEVFSELVDTIESQRVYGEDLKAKCTKVTSERDEALARAKCLEEEVKLIKDRLHLAETSYQWYEK